MPNHDEVLVAVTLDGAQTALFERIARSYADAAPQGWVRIVVREECSVEAETEGSAAVSVVIVETLAGLEQLPFRRPRDLYFEASDMLEEIAASSPTKAVVLWLQIDRDLSHEVTVTQDVPRVLVGIRDETSSRPVHDYLEHHRDELTRLAR